MIGVLQFPGSNCDLDIINVLGKVLNEDVKLIFFKNQEGIEDLDGLVIPGGFSYGDHLRSGAIAAKMPVMEKVKELAKEGKPIIGICNGFQILCDSGILPGALTNNESMKFICKSVELEVNNDSSAFTNLYKKGDIVNFPIAHGEGRYYCDDETLQELKENDQIAFKYVDNPNGAREDIAGVCNKEGNVLGLMPHPERASESVLGGEDGLKMFQSMINFINSK